MSRIIVRAEARAEIVAAFAWYEARSSAAALRFLTSVEATIEGISANPEVGPVVVGDVRRRLLADYPYGLYYTITGEVVQIIGLVHGRRDPRVWRGRR